jgi:hypothetical protein
MKEKNKYFCEWPTLSIGAKDEVRPEWRGREGRESRGLLFVGE